jgi:condensin complex subunit 1
MFQQYDRRGESQRDIFRISGLNSDIWNTQNSDRLYQGLGDKDLVVKKNTLMVLTHLILNGMIKVKGQLGEMAKCTEDEEPRVSDLAKLFFDELSKKDNSLYNNLQDIISHLSVGQHAVDEEMFERIMKTVFGYIEKVSHGSRIYPTQPG